MSQNISLAAVKPSKNQNISLAVKETSKHGAPTFCIRADVYQALSVPSAAPLGPSRYLPSKALGRVAAVSHTQ